MGWVLNAERDTGYPGLSANCRLTVLPVDSVARCNELTVLF
jgi:hypothetical protein